MPRGMAARYLVVVAFWPAFLVAWICGVHPVLFAVVCLVLFIGLDHC
jgi:hypothetical protein